MTQRTDILTPVGRLVQGSLYKPNTTDTEGNPLVVKSGANAGQPRQDYYFALAIPKGAEQSWQQTTWGAAIFNAGRIGFPQAHLAPTFAWKVKDGDSTIPNRKGKRPCDQTGYPGHWVLSFSSGYPPKIVRDKGTVPMTDPDAVKLGDWVQVFGSTGDNGSQQQPGVYLNHNAVNFIGYGERISTGVDTTTVGFGVGIVMPPGVSATPAAEPWQPPAPVAQPTAAPAIQPHTAFLTPPVPPAAPPAAAPVAPPAKRLTALAGANTYESFLAQGWNDALLIQHGYMLPF